HFGARSPPPRPAVGYTPPHAGLLPTSAGPRSLVGKYRFYSPSGPPSKRFGFLLPNKGFRPSRFCCQPPARPGFSLAPLLCRVLSSFTAIRFPYQIFGDWSWLLIVSPDATE